MKFVFAINPVPKPRMTQRDRWKKRHIVLEYYRFKDELNILAKKNNFKIPDSGMSLTFRVAVPESASKKKKKAMIGTPHQQRPDLDNFIKAFLDCLCEEDSSIWEFRAEKLWDEEGSIEVTVD